ncbi:MULTISPECIES: DMT family transporter [unclassified Nocardioides]|uniref:DMT family transporter n=1 Tax=unclassified Nocardioides TaxID=2615069 RepID=UPI0024067CF6|nr:MULTISPECIES: DMT family transporter [unclassified Nocardioides]
MTTAPAAGPARRGLAQVCAAGVLWGTGGLAVHELHEREGMASGTVSAWRMGLAALVLVVVVLALRQGPAVAALARRHPVRTALLGAATAAYQGLYFAAVLTAGIGVATVVALGLAPPLVTVVECLRERRAPRPGELVALVAALAGLALVTYGGSDAAAGPSPLLGVGLAVAAAVGYAATTLVGRTVSQEAPPLALTTLATTVGALLLLPWAAVEAARGLPVATTDPVSLTWLVWLGVATMALAYGLLYAGLRTTSSGTATVATLLEPVSAALLAALVADERLGPVGVVGGVLILLAVAVRAVTEPRGTDPTVVLGAQPAVRR